VPEFQPGASDVVVWESPSVFVHTTVVPDLTFRSRGMKALFPSDSAFAGITTDDDAASGAGAGDGVGAGAGSGEGDGAGDEELSPHAVAHSRSAERTTRRSENIRSS
jgi:hypothetical protein